MMCHFPSEWQPRIQTWPPGAQSTAGGTALLTIVLEVMARVGLLLQTTGFSLALKNLGF